MKVVEHTDDCPQVTQAAPNIAIEDFADQERGHPAVGHCSIQPHPQFTA